MVSLCYCCGVRVINGMLLWMLLDTTAAVCVRAEMPTTDRYTFYLNRSVPRIIHYSVPHCYYATAALISFAGVVRA